MKPSLQNGLQESRARLLRDLDVLKGDVMKVVDPAAQLFSPERGQPPLSTARRAQMFVGVITSALGLPLQLLNSGFSLVTAEVAKAFPPLPAAALGDLYIGPPHGHWHPPSLVPPATVPVPLPSIGVIAPGTSLKVLIQGKPAARVGDLGIAPTCGGILPMFEIQRGSSKVFIGGKRAARMTDQAEACASANSGMMSTFAAVSMALGFAGGALGVAADAGDAKAAKSAAAAEAATMAAALGAAQLAQDAAVAVVKAMLGKDPAHMGAPGCLASGSPKVFIGGFPMIDIPDPVAMLFERLEKGSEEKPKSPDGDEDGEGKAGAGSCPI